MPNKEELKKLLNQLKSLKAGGVSDVENDISALKEKIISELTSKINEAPILKVLEKLNSVVSKLKADFETANLVKTIESIGAELEKAQKSLEQELRTEISFLESTVKSGSKTVGTFESALSSLDKKYSEKEKEIKGIYDSLSKIQAEVDLLAEEEKTEKKEDFSKTLKDLEEKLRREFLSRISNLGGGSMNRSIAIGGNTSVLSRYTDLNIKAGSNVTLTYANNNTTKYVDLTITSTGGGGSVGGTVRSINNISTSDTAGSTAGTDYVYIASAGVALTLPTANANTNLYTVKNTSTSSVLVIPDGVDTIDAQTNVILRTQYTSVDLISDGTSNWSIT